MAGEKPNCGFWFGGPDNAKLLKALVKDARGHGYAGGSAGRLGDGTEMYLFNNNATSRSLIIIADNAGGEVDFEPATAVVMNPKT